MARHRTAAPTESDAVVARQQFYADGTAAYVATLRTNQVYRADDVHAYLKARVAGANPARPLAVALAVESTARKSF